LENTFNLFCEYLKRRVKQTNRLTNDVGFFRNSNSGGNKKHVCYGFNLERAGASAALSAIGLSWNAIIGGQVMFWDFLLGLKL
jgi:hypothetical protein